MGNFFARRAATDARILKRSCESLIGICNGLMADGKLDDQEIIFLDTWLKENDQLCYTWPGEVVFQSVQKTLEDGIITEKERQHLQSVLRDLIGGTLEEDGSTTGKATALPLDSVDEVIIPEKRFCFTGEFLFGTRPKCHKATEEAGGIPSKGVTLKLDYLVIGAMASHEWAYSSHGRKIEKAMNYKRDRDASIMIIHEEQWIEALK